MSNFVSRLVVSAIGLPLVLGLAWIGGWWLFALALVAALVAAHEFWLLARAVQPLAPAGYIGVVLAIAGAEAGGVRWLVGGVVASVVLSFALKVVSDTRTAATVAVSSTVLVAAWIGLGVGFLVLVREIPEHGRLAIFTVLLAVWAGDTLAYLGGRLVGRHKMAPSTSPGKTWEGFFFGSAATIFVAFVALYKSDFLSVPESIILGAALALAAPAGDLFESLLKRDMDVKDSGRLLGGHGGMLDRIDALLFAAPTAYYCIAAFGHA
jgi:phosphatidate cytidylyltransferase